MMVFYDFPTCSDISGGNCCLDLQGELIWFRWKGIMRRIIAHEVFCLSGFFVYHIPSGYAGSIIYIYIYIYIWMFCMLLLNFVNHIFLMFTYFYCYLCSVYSLPLCHAVYCLCINVYCTLPPGVNPIAVNNIYLICVSYTGGQQAVWSIRATEKGRQDRFEFNL
jgi:hypothetical protein